MPGFSQSLHKNLRSAVHQGIDRYRRLLDPLLRRRRPGRAALLHVGRSGSTVLGSMLGQHRRVYWNGEVLAPALRHGAGEHRKDSARNILTRNARSAGTRYHLISLKFYHLEAFGYAPGDYAEFLHDCGISHPVVLSRENLLRKMVSSVIASQSGRYHRRVGEAAPSPNRVAIDPGQVAIDGRPVPLLDHLDRWQHELDAMEEAVGGRPHLNLSFEKDVETNPVLAYRRVCQFLEIRAGEPEIVFQPTNPFPLAELIENFDQVADHLAGTRYEWMLSA